MEIFFVELMIGVEATTDRNEYALLLSHTAESLEKQVIDSSRIDYSFNALAYTYAGRFFSLPNAIPTSNARVLNSWR